MGEDEDLSEERTPTAVSICSSSVAAGERETSEKSEWISLVEKSGGSNESEVGVPLIKLPSLCASIPQEWFSQETPYK